MKQTLLAIDIETKSVTKDKDDALNPFKNEITCIGVYGKDFSKVYRAPWTSFIDEIYNNKSYVFTAHNGKFDLKHLSVHLGYELPDLDNRWAGDTRLMAFVSTDKIPQEYLDAYEMKRKELNKHRTNPHREAKMHSLKTLAPYFLDVEPFWEPDESHDSDEYVLKDCEYTYNLHMIFEEKLKASGQYDFYYDKLMPWTKMILRAELEGVLLDVEEVKKLQAASTVRILELQKELEIKWKDYYLAYYNKQLSDLEQEYTEMCNVAVNKKPDQREKLIIKYSGLLEKAKIRLASSSDIKLNLDSPAQLKWLLKDQMGLDITNLNGEESSDKEVLNKLARENPDVRALLELKKLTKLTTAFLPKYLDLKTEANKIHCDFNIDGTRTGRLSSSGPNLQQHPKKLKHLFTCTENEQLITFDVTAIEPLLMAYYTEDVALTTLIQEGKSLHSVNAIIMFNLDCEESEVKEKYNKERDIAKTIGLAVLYGAGWRQVELACRKEGIFFTERQCKDIVDRIRDSYRGVWEFKKALDNELIRGEIIYNLLGRPIKFTDPDDVYMKGFNTLIQGSASDLVLDIGLDISKIDNCKPVLFVHDSIITKYDGSGSIELCANVIKEKFERKLTNGITTFKLKVDGGYSNVWT